LNFHGVLSVAGTSAVALRGWQFAARRVGGRRLDGRFETVDNSASAGSSVGATAEVG
jgi:hypothetical protein